MKLYFNAVFLEDNILSKDEIYKKISSKVSEGRNKRANKYLLKMDKWHCLLGEMLIFKYLEENLCLYNKKIKYSYNVYGKPNLLSPIKKKLVYHILRTGWYVL